MHPMERIIRSLNEIHSKLFYRKLTDARMLKAAREAADAKSRM